MAPRTVQLITRCSSGVSVAKRRDALRKNWPQFFTAYYLADKVSLMSSVYTHRYDSVDHQRLGRNAACRALGGVLMGEKRHTRRHLVQTILLEDLDWSAWGPGAPLLARRTPDHQGSGHTIQLEKPQAVIDAVDEVLRQLHTGAKP